MRLLQFAFILAMGGASLATFATSQTLKPVTQRPTADIAADLGVAEVVFIRCFSGVSSDLNHQPNGAVQRTNKENLLGCLQGANPQISNDLLDCVMDRYRAKRPSRG